MFMFSKEELRKLGAENTTREIRQQPELWHETFDRYQETVADLDRLLRMRNNMLESDQSESFLQGPEPRNMWEIH